MPSYFNHYQLADTKKLQSKISAREFHLKAAEKLSLSVKVKKEQRIEHSPTLNEQTNKKGDLIATSAIHIIHLKL